MRQQPSVIELLEATRAFLEQRALPELQGRTAFHARVAINALAIVQRELEIAPGAERDELARLRALLRVETHEPATAEGRDDELESLNRELCRRIAAGEIDAGTPGLAEHLWSTTLAKLAIDQPRYERYRRTREGAR